MKETLNFEKEIKQLSNENSMLKSKLYGAALNSQSLSYKIENLKDDLCGNAEDLARMKSDFVEKVADFIFKLHNIGV